MRCRRSTEKPLRTVSACAVLASSDSVAAASSVRSFEASIFYLVRQFSVTTTTDFAGNSNYPCIALAPCRVERGRLHVVGLVEGVVGVHRLGGEDPRAHLLRRRARDLRGDARRVVGIGVHQRQHHRAIGSARRRHAHCGDRDLAVFVFRRRELGRQQGGVLEGLVHLEHVVRGREQHLFLVGEDHRLQHVDHLRDVGHAHAVGVAVEDIEVEPRDDGVAHGVLLEQEARVRAGLDVVPRAPFIHVQRRPSSADRACP